MTFILILPLLLQSVAMSFDEFYFHRRRGLPRWERNGHPLDTLTVILCCSFCLFVPFSSSAQIIFWGLVGCSCIFVTKDEWVHASQCEPAEHWLHAVLFVLHPLALLAIGEFWRSGHLAMVQIALTLLGGFLLYQIVYWRLRARSQ